MTERSTTEYVLITGKGRSGTTWLAHLLATHPRTIYKHEPFLPNKPAPYLDWCDDLHAASTADLRGRFDRFSRRAYVGVDEPMPAQPGMRPLPEPLLKPLHSAARRVPALRPLFRVCARPRVPRADAVLIKDVNFPNESLPRLCEVLEPRLLAVVRNPFANIASLLAGVEIGTFGTPNRGDIARVLELLERPDHAHLAEYRERIADLSWVEFEALRWRVQAEPLARFAEQHAAARLIVYERLCEQPLEMVSEIFDFLDWPLGASTRDFIESSMQGPNTERDPQRAFYSVYRNPLDSQHKWKERLSLAQQNQIAGIVKDSPILGLWPELPI